MSMAEPEDMDSIFNQMVEGLEEELDLPDVSSVVSVALLDELELSKRFNEVRNELLQRGEMITPTTERGRELHSLRSAYLVEMRKRKMM